MSLNKLIQIIPAGVENFSITCNLITYKLITYYITVVISTYHTEFKIGTSVNIL